MFQEGRTWENDSTTDGHKTRKRKLDKDGFVVPEAPDRLSSPYAESTGFDVNERFKEIGHETNEAGDSETLSGYSELTEAVGYLETNGFTETSDYFTQPANMLHPTSEDNLPVEGDGAASQDSGENMLQLLEDFKIETVSVFEEWSKILCKSEEFEIKCPQKLDQLIDEARTIDTTLKERKELFKRKLSGLENTLQMA